MNGLASFSPIVRVFGPELTRKRRSGTAARFDQRDTPVAEFAHSRNEGRSLDRCQGVEAAVKAQRARAPIDDRPDPHDHAAEPLGETLHFPGRCPRGDNVLDEQDALSGGEGKRAAQLKLSFHTLGKERPAAQGPSDFMPDNPPSVGPPAPDPAAHDTAPTG